MKNEFPSALQEQLLADVRSKKDLAFLSTEFILYHAAEQLRLSVKLRSFFSKTPVQTIVKSKQYDMLVKFIRAKCRTTYAVYQIPSLVQRRRELLLTAKLSDEQSMNTLLQTHLSTKERFSIYPQIFAAVRQRLSSITRVLDIACGLNPVAYYYFAKQLQTQIVCNEISDIDCDHLNSFFANNALPAKAYAFDVIRQSSRLSESPFDQQCDVCFLFKTLDTLESQRLYVTYDLLKAIQARLLVASFPIRSVSGKRMARSEQIHWFEKMLARLQFSFETVVLGDEVFYFCTKIC